ncbi:MFS transporter [Chloroflexota bacterium]
MTYLNQMYSKVFYGWWIVGASFLIAMFLGGFVILGFTAFFEPIVNTFGWSYTQISLAASLRGIEVGLLAPLIGLMVDRWGPRRLTVSGSILIGFGLFLLSRMNSLGMFYGGFIIIALGFSLNSPTVYMTTVTNWFRKKAGLATGIVSSGFAMGGLLVPLVVKLIDAFDWRQALLILGIAICAICLPLSLVFRHKPGQYGYLPDGKESIVTTPGHVLESAETPEIVMGIKQALKSRAFWHIGLSMFFSFLAISTVTTHIMPYLSSVNVPRSTASIITMAVMVLSIAGRLGSGWLGDKINKKRIVTGAFAFLVLGLLCMNFASSNTMWIIVLFIIIFGIGWGAIVTTRVTILREYFGKRKFGSIFGIITGFGALGSVLGPLFAGWVFDQWGSYQIAWLTLIVLAFFGMIIITATPPPTTSTQLANK